RPYFELCTLSFLPYLAGSKYAGAFNCKAPIRKTKAQKYKTQRSAFLMRKPVIAGNWKMYKTLSDAVETVLALKPLVANANHCEVVVAPVFTAIKTVADRLEGSNISVAGQNCSTEVEQGAHTGEVAA